MDTKEGDTDEQTTPLAAGKKRSRGRPRKTNEVRSNLHPLKFHYPLFMLCFVSKFVIQTLL